MWHLHVTWTFSQIATEFQAEEPEIFAGLPSLRSYHHFQPVLCWGESLQPSELKGTGLMGKLFELFVYLLQNYHNYRSYDFLHRSIQKAKNYSTF